MLGVLLVIQTKKYAVCLEENGLVCPYAGSKSKLRLNGSINLVSELCICQLIIPAGSRRGRLTGCCVDG